MKTRIASLLLLLGASVIQAQALKIQTADGSLESAFVTWGGVSGADAYNVYLTGGALSNHKLEAPLIRQYGGYFRADAPGLKPGSYTFKVAPVIAGKEGALTASSTVTVKAYDRAGFAFSGDRIPGSYNLDGTPMTGAVILYVTDKTKDTVSMTVTGASTNPCVGLQTILDAYKKGKETRPLIVRLVGQVKDPTYLLAGDLVIENANLATGHITIEGVGPDAVADGWGIRIKNASNIEVRNLGIMNVNSSEGDNVGLQQANDHVWVHNVDFFYGDAGSDADQAKGDGSLDCKKSTYVTFSYNRFWDNGKVNLLGLSEGTTAGLYITYHHNWYDHSDSRHPRVRYYSAHVYNNYYDGNSKYGAGSTLGSSVFMEGNYFRNCKLPMLTSLQGSDVWSEAKQANDPANMGTFSGEAGGTIKAWNNYISGARRFVAYGDAKFPNSTVDFDAWVASSRTDKVPATVKSFSGGNTYNNFDTDAAVMYPYTADAPDAAKANVMAWAGRVQGGDFKWTYTAADDSSSAVNPAMKAALIGYKSPILRIQGEGAFLPVVSTSQRTATVANPIHYDARTQCISLSEGYVANAITLHDMTGATVLQSRLKGSSLSLANLDRGLYIAQITTDHGTFQKRILTHP